MTERVRKLLFCEGFLYLLFGGLTTVVNYIVYFLCTSVFGVHYLIANGIAWTAAVIFAFFTNRALVFKDRDQSKKIGTEFLEFISGRIFSGLLETLLLWVLVDLSGLHDGLSKILVSVITVIVNYFFSKFLVFRKKKDEKTGVKKGTAEKDSAAVTTE